MGDDVLTKLEATFDGNDNYLLGSLLHTIACARGKVIVPKMNAKESHSYRYSQLRVLAAI